MKSDPQIEVALKSQVLVNPIRHLDEDCGSKEVKLLIQSYADQENDNQNPLVEMLNALLSDEIILSQKTRGAYWNLSGNNFPELYTLFKTQYSQLTEITDDINKRIKDLKGIGVSTFDEFLGYSRLEEKASSVPELRYLLADHEFIIRQLNEDIRQSSEEYEDDCTAEFMISVMSLHETMAWMLRSFIVMGNEQSQGVSQKKAV